MEDFNHTSVIGVDATQNTAVHGHHVVHDEIPRTAVVGAVATATGNFSVVVGIKVPDADRASPVELENLVVCMESASADDIRGS
jgi:hypothetical protein